MNDYSKLNKVSLEIRNQVEEREHFHQDIELIYVLDGAMTVEVGNQKSELKAEDILVINANKKHWLRTNDKDISPAWNCISACQRCVSKRGYYFLV